MPSRPLQSATGNRKLAINNLPIVLHHGFGLGDFAVGPIRMPYFRGIERGIAGRGHRIITSRVHPTGSIEVRARQLKENIKKGLKNLDLEHEKVLLIGHSMGGLDARYMISQLGMADQIAALLTITTPHRGSPYADWCLLNLGQKLGGLRLMNMIGLDVRAVSDLTTKSCKSFNREIKNVNGVQYFSVSAAQTFTKTVPWAMHAHRIVEAAEGDNDGLVSIKSATWGEHLQTWPADHFHTINHRFIPELGNATGDITPYYLKAIDQVMKRL